MSILRKRRLATAIGSLIAALLIAENGLALLGVPATVVDALFAATVAGLTAAWPFWVPRVAPALLKVRAPRAAELRRLRRLLGSSADRAGRALPRLLVVANPSAQAFALGTVGSGLIIVSTGLVDDVDDRKLAAILRHEHAHIRLRHMQATGGYLASWFLVKLFFPVPFLWTVIFFLAYLALLRANEFAADRAAAAEVGPDQMCDALNWVRLATNAPRWTESSCLVWASTHPTFSQRIRALQR